MERNLSGVAASSAVARLANEMERNLSGVAASSAIARLANEMERNPSGVAASSAVARLAKEMERNLSGVAASSAVARLARQMEQNFSGVAASSAVARLANATERSFSAIAASSVVGKVAASLLGASVIGRYDVGLLAQSLAAVTLPRPMDETWNNSFLWQGVKRIEEIGQVTEAGESAPALDEIIGSLLGLFEPFFEGARTLFEAQALVNALMLLLTTVILFVNIDQRDIAREALEDAHLSADHDSSSAVWIERELRTLTDAEAVRDVRLHSILERLDKTLQATQERAVAQRGARYIVKRETPVKALRQMRSETISNVYPNQVVDLVKKDSKWIEIRFYDHLSGLTRTGWVVKKYLKRISAS
jgi:hypothetical protein